VLYGLGVTIGAGIFALIGEILGIAGDFAPFAFLLASILAGASAGSYALLAGRYPKAAGEAVYAQEGFGPTIGRVAGIGVATTGILSSGVVALAFASYLSTIVPLPSWLLALALVVSIAAVAAAGVRTSVFAAAAITLIEVGTLLVVIVAGAPELGDGELWQRVAVWPETWTSWSLVFPAVTVAFFAYIGFEDIVNMAEETVQPGRTLGLAIVITLVVSTVCYVFLATLAVSVGDRIALSDSEAPVAELFAELTGGSPTPIAAIAAIAMVNGVLIQVVMASRVLYGMARAGLITWPWLTKIHETRRTPVNATLLIAGIVSVLVIALPIIELAELTSYVTLAVFSIVNLSLFQIMRRGTERYRFAMAGWGLVAALLCLGLLAGRVVVAVTS
jgi:amino acid transporter